MLKKGKEEIAALGGHSEISVNIKRLRLEPSISECANNNTKELNSMIVNWPSLSDIWIRAKLVSIF